MHTDTLDDVKTFLRGGGRAILLVRHAERPKIPPDDPTFGDSLPITPEGERASRRLGEELKEFAGSVRFCSSPLTRTRMTARRIAEGMGLPDADIPVDGLLGNESFFYRDMAKVVEVFAPPDKFFPASFKYMDEGRLEGFHDLRDAAGAMEKWLFERFDKKLFIVATHDFYIAAFLAAKGAYPEHCKETWPRFLDAGAVYAGAGGGGAPRFALVRTGFSDRITGVGACPAQNPK